MRYKCTPVTADVSISLKADRPKRKATIIINLCCTLLNTLSTLPTLRAASLSSYDLGTTFYPSYPTRTSQCP